MKKTLLFVCSLLICMSTNAADFESAKDAVKNMGVGWNLGNTLDANNASKTWKTTEEHETCWGQPVTTPELLKMMKEAGFGAIRVPVTWYQEMDANGKVNEAWMKRVKEVVDYVIDNGMYCLLNVHHDTGADGGSYKSWIKASGANYTANKDKYEGLWKQIAETFKNYDQHLLFEAYNEMLDEKNTWNEPVDKTDGYKAINDYAKSFVNAVRATGGNNAQRNLVVNTYSASNSPAAMKALELPEETGHIVFQIHNYPNWKDESTTRQLIDNLIKDIETNLTSKGAPVIIGEYATFTTWPADLDYYKKDRKLALYAMDYFIKKTKEAGIGTFYWMGLSDGIFRIQPIFDQPDLAKALINAYYGSTDGYKFPTLEDKGALNCLQYEKTIAWGTAITINENAFSLFENTVKLQLSFRLESETEPDIQFNDGSWNHLSSVIVDGTAIGADYNPKGTVGTEYSITVTFSQDVYNKLCQGGMLIQGNNVTITKAVLEGTPVTGITPLFIERPADNLIYNLQGQRVDHPQRGIYIQNGKKFVKR